VYNANNANVKAAGIQVTTFQVLAEFWQDSIPHVSQWSMCYWSQRLQCIQYMHATVVTRQWMSRYDLHMNRMTNHLHVHQQNHHIYLVT